MYCLLLSKEEDGSTFNHSPLFQQGLKLVKSWLEDETESDLGLIEGKPTVITMKTVILILIMTNEIIINVL